MFKRVKNKKNKNKNKKKITSGGRGPRPRGQCRCCCCCCCWRWFCCFLRCVEWRVGLEVGARMVNGGRQVTVMGGARRAIGDGWRAAGDCDGSHLCLENKRVRNDKDRNKKNILTGSGGQCPRARRCCRCCCCCCCCRWLC